MNKETKVGLFAVVTIILGLTLSFLMGDIYLFRQGGSRVTFVVADATGLVPKTKVKYMGIQVGEIRDVELQDGMVHLLATIDSGYDIPEDVVITVVSEGIMGGRVIALEREQSNPVESFLQDGGIYSNYAASHSFEDLAGKLMGVADDLKTLTSALNETIASDAGKEGISAIIANLKESTETLNNVLKRNEQRIDNIFADVEQSAATIREVTAGNDKELNEIVQNVAQLTASLNSLSARLDKIVTNEEDNITESISGLRDTVANLKEITSDIQDGKGTIGMLMSDNETRDDLRGAITSISTMIEKGDQLTIGLEAGFDYLQDSDDYKGFFTAKIIPSDKRYYLIGVSNLQTGKTQEKITNTVLTDHFNPANNSNITETEKRYYNNQLAFNLQYALRFDKLLDVRAGIFENALGFGVDVHPFKDDNLTFTVEASDFFRETGGVYWRANARYSFWDYFFVQAGWNDFGYADGDSFTIGAGVRFYDDDLKHAMGSLPIGAIMQ